MPMQPPKKPAARRYVVDRIEEDERGNRFAVMENQDDGSSFDLPASRLPGAKEGALFSVPLRNGQPDWARAQRQRSEEMARMSDLEKRLRTMMSKNPDSY